MMAGKLHRDFQHYARDQDGHALAPGHKGIKAYAEGYQAFRSGAAKANPHALSADDESDFQSWEYGWQDGSRGEPATHVGRPDAVAPSPPPPPPPPPAEDVDQRPLTERLEAIRTHAELDALVVDRVVPASWPQMALAEKRAWIAGGEE